MKSSRYVLMMIASIILVLGVFGLLHKIHVLELPMNLFLIFNILIPFIFLLGGVIIVSGFNKPPDIYVQRFMILTTFQFLAVLAIIGAVWYKSNHNLRAFGLQFVSVFVALMIIQSFLLLRANK